MLGQDLQQMAHGPYYVHYWDEHRIWATAPFLDVVHLALQECCAIINKALQVKKTQRGLRTSWPAPQGFPKTAVEVAVRLHRELPNSCREGPFLLC